MPSSNEKDKKKEIIKNNRKEEGIYKGWRDDKGRVLLKSKKYIFELVWKNNIDNYLCGAGRGNLLTIKE